MDILKLLYQSWDDGFLVTKYLLRIRNPPKVLSPSKAADEVKRFDAQFERCFVARMEVRLGLPPVGALAKI